MANTIKINVDVDDRPVKSLKRELRETIEALQQTDLGTSKFDELNKKASELRDKMNEVNEQVAVFATGSKYEQVSNSFGEIGAGIRDMDFDRITQGAALFKKTAGAITFKDAMGSLKQLGSAFASIGKTLLVNPLFLIVAVVGAIVLGIGMLMKKLGFLDDIFKAIGDAIGFVIQKLKDLLDWLGLTDFAGEESARKQGEAQERIAAAHEKKRASVVDAYDHEIRMAGIAGEDTTRLEKQKQHAIIQTSKAQLEALDTQIKAMRAAGDLTKEKADEIRASMDALRVGIREAKQEIKAISAQDIADQKKASEDSAKTSEATNKAAAEKRKQYAQDRIAAARMVQDAEMALMKDGIAKEHAENKLKFERQIEEVKNNTKLLATEKAALTLSLEEQEFEARKAIEQKYLDESLASVKAAKDAKVLLEAEHTATMKEAADELAAKMQENAQKELEQAQQLKEQKEQIQKDYTGSVIAMSETVFTLANSFGKQDEKSKEARAKRQFNIQKAMNLAMAAMDGYKAITASLSQSPVAIGPVPNPAGIASLAFAISTTASSIAKIAASKYSGGSSGGGGASAPSMGGGVGIPSMGGNQTQQTPQMNLNNGVEQNASSTKRERVIVVDYHDIADKGNQLQMMNQKVTLA